VPGQAALPTLRRQAGNPALLNGAVAPKKVRFLDAALHFIALRPPYFNTN